MQKLDLNLAANPFRNNVLLWIGYGSATAALLLFSVFSIHGYFHYRAQVEELRDRVGNFENRRLDLETRGRRALKAIRDFDIGSLEVQASMANQVIDRKAFSWTRLFNSIEQIQPYKVRMTSVRPVFTGPRGTEEELGTGSGVPVALEGIAKDWIEFTELERALQDDPHFGRVLPIRLTKTDNNEILFQVRFHYYPAGDASADEELALSEEELLAEIETGTIEELATESADEEPPPDEIDSDLPEEGAEPVDGVPDAAADDQQAAGQPPAVEPSRPADALEEGP
jgi:hypothetical protein